MQSPRLPGAPVPELVLASANAGKVREFQALLGQRWRLRPQSDFGISSIEETGTTFEANALLKARHAAALSGLPALADDSGLEVDALAGAPGVYSARYAGPEADDAANNARLLAALAGVPEAARSARFRCVLALVSGPGDEPPIIASGVWEGWILTAPRGQGGFGYDPLFLDAEAAMTAAEMPPADKQQRSHRARALARLELLLQPKRP